MAHDRHRQQHVIVVADEAKAIVTDGVAMRATGDEHDVLVSLEEAGADNPADRPGAIDHEAHGYEPSRNPSTQRSIVTTSA